MMSEITKPRLINMCNIYMLLWVLYSFHWFEVVNTPALNSLSNAFLGFNLILSFYYCFYCLFNYRLPKLYYAILILVLLLALYGLVSVLKGEELYIRFTGEKYRNGSYIIGPMRSFLPFFAFYVFSKRGLLTKESLIIWGGISLLQFLFVFFHSSTEYAVGSFVNNNGYHFTVLLPLLFFIRRPRFLPIGLLVFLIAMVILGMKRGAILVAAFFVIYYLFIILQKEKTARKLFIIIAVLVVFRLGYSYFNDFYANNSILQHRVDSTLEGSSSGRSILYAQAWSIWSQSNYFQLVFGHGASASLKYLDNFIHNDWLELLLDTGIVGVIAFLAFWISFITEWIRSRDNRLLFAVLGGYIVVLLPRTFYGMMYSNLQTIAVMAITYCITVNNNSSSRGQKR